MVTKTKGSFTLNRMLTELHITNFAIIGDLTIPFGQGLNVLTGETGAGKSIIVEALGLIVGERTSNDVIRDGMKEASVVAVFDQKSLPKGLIVKLEDGGFAIEDELIIKRAVFENGKTRAFINGVPVSIAELRGYAPFLLEVSSQHEHQTLLNEEAHLEIIDSFGCTQIQREVFSLEYDKFIKIKERLIELERLAASATEQKEFLSFQIKEIESASLIEGEDQDLARERNVVKNSTKLLENVQAADTILNSSEDSILLAVEKVGSFLARAFEIDDKIKAWPPLIVEAAAALGELSREVQGYLNSIEIDPSRLDQIEERLYEISRLKKKYGDSVQDILSKKDSLKAKLNLIENSSEQIKELNSELKIVKGRLTKVANDLSALRKKSAGKMMELIQAELDTLGLKKTTFAPGHTTLNMEDVLQAGIDKFNFLISPNQGEPMKPLSRIASGGELSRVMLAIKCVLMDKVKNTALEVFDEVDVGIGGAVAEMVGLKLKKMSESRQIIAITHLPQVASFGERHIAVTKTVENNRTLTGFSLLEQEARVAEIARMLGGSEITQITKDHARQMLKRGTN